MLSVQNAAKQNSHTRTLAFCAQKQAAVCKRQSAGALSRACPLSPAAGCQNGGRRKGRNPKCFSNPPAVLSNPKHFSLSLSLSTRNVCFSLSLGWWWWGGWRSQTNTFKPTARVEVTSLPKGERLAGGRGQHNNLAASESRAFAVSRAPTNQSILKVDKGFI